MNGEQQEVAGCGKKEVDPLKGRQDRGESVERRGLCFLLRAIIMDPPEALKRRPSTPRTLRVDSADPFHHDPIPPPTTNNMLPFYSTAAGYQPPCPPSTAARRQGKASPAHPARVRGRGVSDETRPVDNHRCAIR